MERPRARHRRDASRLARRCRCVPPHRRRHHANNICEITEMPVKWSLLRYVNLDLQSHAKPLDSIRGGACIAQNRCWERRIGLKKKLHKSFRKRRFDGRASLNRANRHQPIRKIGHRCRSASPWTRLPTSSSRHRFTLRVAGERSKFRHLTPLSRAAQRRTPPRAAFRCRALP